MLSAHLIILVVDAGKTAEICKDVRTLCSPMFGIDEIPYKECRVYQSLCIPCFDILLYVNER